MFEQVEQKESGGVPWGILGAVVAFGVLLVGGYFLIT